jgi:hypothetical protein
MDAAAFYCPYVPLTSSGVVIDPNTMEPVVSFMTRYGYVELTNTASSLGNAPTTWVSSVSTPPRFHLRTKREHLGLGRAKPGLFRFGQILCFPFRCQMW